MGYLLLTTMSQTANSCYTSSNFLSLSRARPPSTAEDCSACCFFFFQAETGIRYVAVTGFQTCALPIFGLPSKPLPLTEVYDLADTRLAQKISQLTGVGLVSVSGGHRPAVRIQANLRQLAAYGLNIDDLRTTLGTANVNTPKGHFDGPTPAYTINANDQLKKASDYNDL